jgi:hypothetical protein
MKRVTSFVFTGQLQTIEPPKAVQILHQGSLRRVKVAKFLRPSLVRMQPGQWIRVVGEQETKTEDGQEQIRYKATDLMILEHPEATWRAEDMPAAIPADIQTLTQTIKICTKGSCRKQGSLTLLEELSQRCPAGVILVPSGCLKNCKAGPTVCLGSRMLSRATPERVWGSLLV